ncbi:MAG: hypothetical protein SPG61_02045 [Arcanobacterium sp.]|nr:hypothetical protein [Arcanobacterium sp.]
MDDYPIQAIPGEPVEGFDLGVQDGLLEYLPVAQKVVSEIAAPVARVVLDSALAHLNSFYEYSIPKRFQDLRVGAKVRVDFGSQLVSGYVIERVDSSVLAGKLRPIRAVVSNFPLLQPEIYQLAQEISDFTATSIGNILRLAIPARNAGVEKEYRTAIAATSSHKSVSTSLSDSVSGAKFQVFSRHLLASDDFYSQISAILTQGNFEDGVMIILPTFDKAEECAAVISRVFPSEEISLISGGQEPRKRYEEFVRILCGQVRIVIGTRAAAWMPVKNLQKIIIVDDAHAAYEERRAPYLPIREVLRMRAQLQNCALISLSQGPSIWASFWAGETGGSSSQAPAEVRKAKTPHVYGLGELGVDDQPWQRMPASVFKVVREGLQRGSVLIVVPKSGYIPVIACVNCGSRGKCQRCGHLLSVEEYRAGFHCGNCTKIYTSFNCLECGGQAYRALRIGSRRTAQEIGKAFPNQPIVIANPDHELDEITGNKIVIAMPGSEPEAREKYAAGIFLDAGYLLNSLKLDAEQQFLRIIAKTLIKVKAQEDGGEALIVGDIPEDLLMTLGRWDFSTWENAQIQLRQELALPPVATWFEITGSRKQLELLNGVMKERLKNLNTSKDSSLEPKTEITLANFEIEISFGVSLSAIYELKDEVHGDPLHRCVYRINSSQLIAFSRELTTAIRQLELNTRENSIRLRINP